MDDTKIINTAQQKNPLGNGLLATSGTAGTPNQKAQMGAKGGIEAFNIGGVNGGVHALGEIEQVAHHGGRTRQEPALHQPALVLVFHQLNQIETCPGLFAWATDPTGENGFAEQMGTGFGVGAPAVKGNDQRQLLCPIVDTGDDLTCQLFVASRTAHGTEPQTTAIASHITCL